MTGENLIGLNKIHIKKIILVMITGWMIAHQPCFGDDVLNDSSTIAKPVKSIKMIINPPPDRNSLMYAMLAKGGWIGGEYFKYAAPRIVADFNKNNVNVLLDLVGQVPDKYGNINDNATEDDFYKLIIDPISIRYNTKRFHPDQPVGGPGSVQVMIKVIPPRSSIVAYELKSSFGFEKVLGSADEFSEQVFNFLVEKKILALSEGFSTADGKKWKNQPFDWNSEFGTLSKIPRSPPIWLQ